MNRNESELTGFEQVSLHQRDDLNHHSKGDPTVCLNQKTKLCTNIIFHKQHYSKLNGCSTIYPTVVPAVSLIFFAE